MLAALGIVTLNVLCTLLITGILNKHLWDIEERVSKIEEHLKEKAKQ